VKKNKSAHASIEAATGKMSAMLAEEMVPLERRGGM